MNVRTAVNASRAALALLKQQSNGRIINIGAAGAIKAASGMGAYAASKASVAKLTEALADELKDTGITVNAVLPSIIDTAANRADMPNADFTRWVKAEQIAEEQMNRRPPRAHPPRRQHLEGGHARPYKDRADRERDDRLQDADDDDRTQQ